MVIVATYCCRGLYSTKKALGDRGEESAFIGFVVILSIAAAIIGTGIFIHSYITNNGRFHHFYSKRPNS